MLSFLSRTRYIRTNEKPTFVVHDVATSIFEGGGEAPSSQHFYVTGKFRLKLARVIILILLLIMFGFYLYYSLSAPSETFKLYVHAANVVGLNNNGPWTSRSIFLTEYNIWIIAIIYMSLAIVFQIYPILADDYLSMSDDLESDEEVLLNTKKIIGAESIPLEPLKHGKTNEDYYAGILLYGMNWYSWVENAFVTSIILWTVFQFSGVTNVIFLVALTLTHVIMSIAGGYAHEAINSEMTSYDRFRKCSVNSLITSGTSEKEVTPVTKDYVINWLPYVLGMLMPHLLIIMAALITYFSVITTHGTPAWISYASMITVLILLFVLEGLIILVFYVYFLKKTCKGIAKTITDKGHVTDQYYHYEKIMIIHNRNYELSKIILQGSISIIFVLYLTIYTRIK